MTKISSDLLSDTLSLLQLARETALARGNRVQAERLSPVTDNLRTLVTNTRQSATPSTGASVMFQPDFKTILSAMQSPAKPVAQAMTTALERNQIVSGMSSAGMSELDIARQMGLTRDEVRMILKLNTTAQNTRRVM